MTTTTHDFERHAYSAPASLDEGAHTNGALSPGQPLARSLGWFSVGLGAAAILAPRGLARSAGVRPRPALVRAFGARELATGLAILLRRDRPAPWIWARVGGDLMDLGMLGRALRRPGRARSRVATATAAVAGVTALDWLCGTQLARDPATLRARAEHVRCTIRVNREPQHLYRFWRELQNLPRFMQRVESVDTSDGGALRWRATSPAGRALTWEADLIADEPDRRIAWCSRPGADVFDFASIRFTPARGGRGTLVRMDVQQAWPGAGIVDRVARLFGAGTGQRVKQDLRRFKSLMETGEIATTEGQSSGRENTARA